MDNTAGAIIVTVITLLYLFGIGSILLSFFYDPKESPPVKPKQFSDRSTVSSYRSLSSEQEEASVILVDDNASFEFDFEK